MVYHYFGNISVTKKFSLTVLLFGIILFPSCSAFYKEQAAIELKSPNNKYEFIIEQQNPLLSLNRYAYLNVRLDGTIFLDQKLIYQGDFFDGDYVDYYPQNYWISNSIFRSGQSNKKENARIYLSNNRSSSLKYLIFESNRDKMFLFNIPQGERISIDFYVSDQLSVEGVAENSQTVIGKAVEISKKSQGSEEFEFFITISDSEVSIKGNGQELINNECIGIMRPSTCLAVNLESE